MDKVVHFEITADDVARAKAFYEKVFDWKIIKVPMPGMEYMTIHTVETDEKQMPKISGAINGGMMKKGGGAESPVLVIKVDNIADAMKKIEDAGGELVMDVQKIGDMGLYTRFKDSEGSVLGLWQDVKHP